MLGCWGKQRHWAKCTRVTGFGKERTRVTTVRNNIREHTTDGDENKGRAQSTGQATESAVGVDMDGWYQRFWSLNGQECTGVLPNGLGVYNLKIINTLSIKIYIHTGNGRNIVPSGLGPSLEKCVSGRMSSQWSSMNQCVGGLSPGQGFSHNRGVHCGSQGLWSLTLEKSVEEAPTH